MPDLASISAVLGSIKTATEIAKLLKDADLSLEKAESKLKLADLITALADARIEIAEVQEALNLKDGEIRALQQALQTHKNLTYEEPCYWHAEGEKREGPYCQQCYDKDRKLIRLQGGGDGVFQCKSCKNMFVTPAHREQEDRAVREGPRFA